MVDQPPANVLSFDELVKNTSLSELVPHPNVVQFSSRSSPPNPGSILRPAPQTREQNTSNYPKTPAFQVASFDFRGGFCSGCPRSSRRRHVKHVHGIQGGHVYNLEGLPGVTLYPRLFIECLIERRLIDELLVGDEKLSGPSDLASPNKPASSEPKPLPKSVATFFAGLFDLREQTGSLQVSNAASMPALNLVNSEEGIQLFLSFGCDCALVLGSDADASAANVNYESVLYRHAHDFINTDSNSRHPGGPSDEVARQTAHAAILLRSGDVFTLNEQASRTWIGIAQVLESPFACPAQGSAQSVNGATGSWQKAYYTPLNNRHVLFKAC
ncbi:hypothetical protein CBER1_04552 [Cercospora berteroae]|uniref:Uncharacterized protein n=1 Tax=Cercospora berteroae TaxID=357750 RepID=A0A2S6C218_9PEZI|nr:hypothetical protein CBER1_04552 [Cercospora berteroae]